MTKAIREGPNSTNFGGSVSVQDQRILVNGWWMALPVALVLCSGAFPMMAVTFAAENSKTVWKSSSLPVLFHGPFGWEDDGSEGVELREMQTRAEGMWANLREVDLGVLRLAKA